MQRLREAAEKAKRELDGLAATEVSLLSSLRTPLVRKHRTFVSPKRNLNLRGPFSAKNSSSLQKLCQGFWREKEELTEVLLVGA
ncbi:unnamed protein product [Sphagnum jensenii]|uniref:Uncharacterized protein n=1 Tax=Sphagnum jensenii TaxID=128206 RepID=A0ABP1A1M1_9BRYO